MYLSALRQLTIAENSDIYHLIRECDHQLSSTTGKSSGKFRLLSREHVLGLLHDPWGVLSHAFMTGKDGGNLRCSWYFKGIIFPFSSLTFSDGFLFLWLPSKVVEPPPIILIVLRVRLCLSLNNSVLLSGCGNGWAVTVTSRRCTTRLTRRPGVNSSCCCSHHLLEIYGKSANFIQEILWIFRLNLCHSC